MLQLLGVPDLLVFGLLTRDLFMDLLRGGIHFVAVTVADFRDRREVVAHEVDFVLRHRNLDKLRVLFPLDDLGFVRRHRP